MKKIKQFLKNLLSPTIYECAVNANHKQLYEFAAMRLKNSCLTSNTVGISNEKIADAELVVSLTTYSKRLYEVYLTIESIMQGTLKPNRIILWLEEELKDGVLPLYLQRQIVRGLEVRYYKNIRSYKKLIPSLKAFPNSIIVTIDDDVIYEPDLIEKLVKAYIKDPHHVYANRVSRIEFDNDGNLKKYADWTNVKEPGASPRYFFTGVGGVLYPPHCFTDEVLNEDIFKFLSPYGDDIWFYAMALSNGYTVSKVYTHDVCGNDYLVNDSVQDISLYHINNEGDMLNDKQMKAVFEKYGIYKLLK